MPQSANPRAAFIALMIAIPTCALAYEGHELAGTAKVTIEEARRIALKERPGHITAEELEKESGGSGLRYSFVVKSDKVLYEIGVDAQTGKILEDVKEGSNPD
jgi:uncharacterized membrane protein YkoI